MKPDPKTLALVALAAGMLTSAYMIGPAPGATVATIHVAPQPAPVVATAPPASPIKAAQAPVPLLAVAHSEFFAPVPDDSTPPAQTAAAPATADGTPVDTSLNVAAAPTGDDSAAKSAIEQDGYRNVRMLAKDPDGSWRGRAMRGSTEIVVRVTSDGSVAAD
jgi:hypothetical protein